MHRSVLIALPILSLVCVSTTHAQKPLTAEELKDPTHRACWLVTPEEAATILGGSPQAFFHDACHYLVQGQSLDLVIGLEESSAVEFLTDRREAMAAKGYTFQDEPSFGKGAFSARKRDSFDFELLAWISTELS